MGQRPTAGRVAGDETGAAMLADDPLPQIFDPDVQFPTTRRTLLNEVRLPPHVGTSCIRQFELRTREISLQRLNHPGTVFK